LTELGDAARKSSLKNHCQVTEKERDYIMRKSTNVTKSNKQAMASIIASAIIIFATTLIIVAYGGRIGDFIHVPTWLSIIVLLLPVLTITRSFKLFGSGFRAALFPKREISDDEKQQAASLFRLLSKTIMMAGIIIFIIEFISTGISVYYNSLDSSDFMERLFINVVFLAQAPLYSLCVIVFVFEPIVYLLKKRRY